MEKSPLIDLLGKQTRELSVLRSIVQTIIATQAENDRFVAIFKDHFARLDAGFNASTTADSDIEAIKAAYQEVLPRGFAERMSRLKD